MSNRFNAGRKRSVDRYYYDDEDFFPDDIKSESSGSEFDPTDGNDLTNSRKNHKNDNHSLSKCNKRNKKQNKSLQKIDVNRISLRACIGNKVKKDDPRCYFGPDGKPCRFINLDEIKNDILSVEKLLQPGETCINTILPSFDPVAPNKLQFFGIEESIHPFSHKDLSTMSIQELLEWLALADEYLSESQPNDALTGDFLIVTPYDHTIKKSISIQCDVRKFDWKMFGSLVQFDVVIMDPPWDIQASNVTRGVDITYDLLHTNEIASMGIPYIQNSGYIFMWVVASTLPSGSAMLERWGYKVIGFYNWVKVSGSGRYQPSNGYVLQHDKESLLIGRKGHDIDCMNKDKFVDYVVSERMERQSQKPPGLYEMIEEVFPNCLYLEIFARPHNLREGWVSLGLEVPD